MSHKPGYHLRYRAEGANRPYVDGSLAGAHIRRLQSVGMSRRQVQIAAKVDYMTVKAALDGKRMQQEKVRSILAVKPRINSRWCFVPAAPTLALIEDMWARGYSKAWITENAGIFQCPKPNQRKVRAFVALAIKELHEFTQGQRGVCRDGRSLGKRDNGYRNKKMDVAQDRQRGGSVNVNVTRLFDAIPDDILSFSRRCGIDKAQLYQIRKRGSCDYYTLDRIAVALNRHPDQFVVEEAS